MDLEQKLLDLLTTLRPKSIEIEAYPQVVALLINTILLEVTRKE